jgi:hypothetical protein
LSREFHESEAAGKLIMGKMEKDNTPLLAIFLHGKN